MKHKKIVLAIFAVVFIIVMALNFGSVDRVWMDWIKGEKQAYHGNIELWHIKDSFDLRLPYASMVKKYEKSNFGVFINVEYLTQSEAQDNISRGVYPDIITYSANILENPKDELASLTKVDCPILQSGEIGGDIKAYPFAYDSYTAIINDEILGELDIDVPGIIDAAFISSLISNDLGEGILPLAFSSEGAAANYIDGGGQEYSGEYQEASLKDFEQGKVAVLICSNIAINRYSGELPSYSQVNLSLITDRVRFLSVYGGKKDENRLQCSREIARLFMEERFQKQISENGFSFMFGYGSQSADMPFPIRVFNNDLSKDKAIEMFKSNPNGLVEKINEIYLK